MKKAYIFTFHILLCTQLDREKSNYFRIVHSFTYSTLESIFFTTLFSRLFCFENT